MYKQKKIQKNGEIQALKKNFQKDTETLQKKEKIII